MVSPAPPDLVPWASALHRRLTWTLFLRRHRLLITNLTLSVGLSGAGDLMQQEHARSKRRRRRNRAGSSSGAAAPTMVMARPPYCPASMASPLGSPSQPVGTPAYTTTITALSASAPSPSSSSSSSSSSILYRYDLGRTARMSASFGLLGGWLWHHWYLRLDRLLPGRGLKVVLKKMLVDQLAFTPLALGTCLLVLALVEGKAAKWRTEVKDKGFQLFLADLCIFPPAQFVNFYFLPVQYRLAFDNVVSLVYDFYTSHVRYPDVDDDVDEDERGKLLLLEKRSSILQGHADNSGLC